MAKFMENGINKITISNCNNISIGNIEIINKCLNLKFAPNGTGKSTIAKAIDLIGNNKELSELHSFGTEEDPSLSSTKPVGKVLIFDEDFVNNIVFLESEVIEKSFEIFIKTPSYDERIKNVNERLSVLKIDIGKDDELLSLINTFSELTTKIQFNTNGEIKSNPFFKSIISKQHLYKIPDNLQKFKSFIETDYTVEWIDWKNKGFEFDDKEKCPFCTEKFIAEYQKEKETFTNTYSKNNAKNLKDFLGYFITLKEYISTDKYKLLNDCIKTITDEDQIRTIIKQFIIEIILLKDKIREIVNFDSFRINSNEISELDKKLTDMKINPELLNMLNSEKTIEIISRINSKINLILMVVSDVKKEIGELKGVIQGLANSAKKDINSFLESAGINYELMIEVISESDSKTILKYKDRKNDRYEVDKIKKHLSWGERNAFALVLFMHYSLSQNPDLIILDDPISSFDSHKKYAIINRLFKNNGKHRSFYKQTVLMLTHDLEPVIDFIVINKPTGGFVFAFHLENQNGIVSERPILIDDMHSQIKLLASIITDEKVNEVNRLISLRKYIEHTETSIEKEHAYNIISCLLKAKKKPDKKINSIECIDMNFEEINIGTNYIISWIPTFSYDLLIRNTITLDALIKSYNLETCNYFKLQLFRIILEFENNRVKICDDNFLNHIDQTYHVENDYLYNLDFRKFEMIPEYIINKCNDFVSTNFN